MIAIKQLNRYTAFTAHLLLSVFIFSCLIGAALFFWYPGDLIHAGGYQGIKIIAGVDLVLGPLLTLLLFSPQKKGLYLDLSIIAIIQVSALCYGVYALSKEKPVTVVLANDALYIHAESDFVSINPENEFNANQATDTSRIYYLDLPTDTKAIQNLAQVSIFVDSMPLAYRQDLYISELPPTLIPIYKHFHKWDSKQKCLITHVSSKHLPSSTQACIDLSSHKFWLL